MDEAGAEVAQDLWDHADLVTVARIAYPEARAAFASAQRAGRISTPELHQVRVGLNRLWAQMQVVELDETLSLSAGDLAESFGLRGFDAVHLATAIALRDESLVVATWDADLNRATLEAGLSVAPAI